MPRPASALPALLKDRLARQRMSQVDLARSVGVSNTAVYNWLNGTQPNAALLPSIAKALGVDTPTVARAAGYTSYPSAEDKATDSDAGARDGLRSGLEALADEYRAWTAQGADLMERLDTLVSCAQAR